MRVSLLCIAICVACPGVVQASGTFTALETANLQISKISPNGAYATGAIGGGGAGVRWIASTGEEQIVADLNAALGINDSGTISGSVPENGGSINGGSDLGAYAPIGGAAVLLTDTLQSDSTGYDISADGTVVGLSFNQGFVGPAVAFIWTAADGMSALTVNRPDNYSRANAISADGRVIAGWNDQDDGYRTAVIWQDGVPLDVTDADGILVGEASRVSGNGEYVVGNNYTDIDGNSGAWIWNAKTGLRLIPDMPFAFGVSDDGKTVVGNSGFFDDPPRAAKIWREGIGTMLLTDFLAEQDIEIPAGWNLSGGLGALSADGTMLAGWGFGPLGMQSYVVRFEDAAADTVFADGFDGSP
jgi:probable HAF family extracellular repeat protein